jgi:hypothetical protein
MARQGRGFDPRTDQYIYLLLHGVVDVSRDGCGEQDGNFAAGKSNYLFGLSSGSKRRN